MRRIFATVAVAAVSQAGVSWQDAPSLDAVLEQARQQNKPLAIDVFATWCGPCQEMDRTIYSRDDVAKLLERDFIPIKVDAEQGVGLHIAERYRVTGYPTLLLLKSDGSELDRVMGTLEPDAFLKTIEAKRDGIDTVENLEQQLANNPHNLELVLTIGQRYAFRGERKAAEWYLNTVLREDPKNKKTYASKALWTLGKFLYVRGIKDYRKGIATLQKLRKLYPNSEEVQDTTESLARAWHALGRGDRARKILDAHLAAHTNDSKAYNLYAWFCYKREFDRLRGLEVAAQGLALHPNDDGLWDTMAELYFAIGNRDQALACERKASALDPSSPYYRQQIERFSSSAVPAALTLH